MLGMRRLYVEGVPGPRVLLLEGVAVSLAGTAAAQWLFPAEAGLVAIFFGAVFAQDSLGRLLFHNREQIQQRGVNPQRANARTGLGLAMLFLGCVLGYSAIGMVLPVQELQELFTNQVRDVNLGDLGRVRFGSPLEIGLHNLGVAMLFFVLALPFGEGGVMLVVCWNASVWGASFGLLAQHMARRGGLGLVDAWLRVVVAHAPHLVLETLAYTVAGLAGTFLSLALQRHRLDSALLPSILRSVWLMGAVGVALVVAGAVVEGLVAPWLARLLAG
jgi:hypothetical protein